VGSRVEAGEGRVEVLVEAVAGGLVGCGLEHEAEDRVEEARILEEGSAIVAGKSRLDSVLGGGGDEFDAAHEDASDLGGCGSDGEGEN